MRKRICNKIKNLERILVSYTREKRRLRILKRHHISIVEDLNLIKQLDRIENCDKINLQDRVDQLAAKIMKELIQK